MITNQALFNQRKIAALASQGISNDVVYKTFEQVLQQINAQGDLLDFGAGQGNLIRCLQPLNMFRSFTAVDIMQRPPEIDQSVTWISCDLNEPTSIPSCTFDVIVSAEVIEHLENPRAIAREWFRLLKPGGVLIFSTPNNESWRSLLALLIRGHFVAFGDTCYPAHITPLVCKDIERILIEAGFSRPTLIFTNVGRVPKLTKFNWHQFTGNLLQGLRYSDNLLALTYKPQG